jgi:hypothetical protein
MITDSDSTNSKGKPEEKKLSSEIVSSKEEEKVDPTKTEAQNHSSGEIKSPAHKRMHFS